MTDARPVRVRFAPSPTGLLHVGSARTAIFNWLFARHYGGIFVLRIEDTDLARSKKEFEENIFDGLKWLGLDWDEGPDKPGAAGFYRQSERNDIYRAYIQKLLDSGQAYHCYCSPERLTQMRQKAEAEKQPSIYDGRCRDLTPAERESFAGKPSVVRFRSNSRNITVNDRIRGTVNFDAALIGDQIIVKSDGSPTYNFAVVIDDIQMNISHVIRGEDHLSNTPKQIMIYEAFGFELPEFAHIPMILGPDRSKLSKRHGAVAVTQYREDGFLSEAFFNYLTLLGWAPGGDQEIMSRAEIVGKFTLENISKSAAIFDLAKLKWMNGLYIRQKLSLADLTDKFVRAAGEMDLGDITRAVIPYIAQGYHNQIELLAEIPAILEKVERLVQRVDYDEKNLKKNLETGGLTEILENILSGFSKLPDYSPNTIEIFLEELINKQNISRGKIYRPLRFVLSGSEVFPEIQYVMAMLGPKICQSRIEYFLGLIKSGKGGAL